MDQVGMLTASTYADAGYTKLVESQTVECPLGSVLHSSRMSLGEAQALALPYVVASGNPIVDSAAVDDLQRSMLSALRPSEPPIASTSMSCQDYFSRTLSYVPGAVGGRGPSLCLLHGRRQ